MIQGYFFLCPGSVKSKLSKFVSTCIKHMIQMTQQKLRFLTSMCISTEFCSSFGSCNQAFPDFLHRPYDISGPPRPNETVVSTIFLHPFGAAKPSDADDRMQAAKDKFWPHLRDKKRALRDLVPGSKGGHLFHGDPVGTIF